MRNGYGHGQSQIKTWAKHKKHPYTYKNTFRIRMFQFQHLQCMHSTAHTQLAMLNAQQQWNSATFTKRLIGNGWVYKSFFSMLLLLSLSFCHSFKRIVFHFWEIDCFCLSKTTTTTMATVNKKLSTKSNQNSIAQKTPKKTPPEKHCAKIMEALSEQYPLQMSVWVWRSSIEYQVISDQCRTNVFTQKSAGEEKNAASFVRFWWMFRGLYWCRRLHPLCKIGITSLCTASVDMERSAILIG